MTNRSGSSGVKDIEKNDSKN